MKIIGLFCIFCLFACRPEGYVFRGQTEGLDGKKVVLLSDTKDTLSWTEIRNGTFELKGQVNDTLAAMLNVGESFYIQVFPENGAVFEMNCRPGEQPEVKSNGKNQQLYEAFKAIDTQKGQQKMKELVCLLQQAQRNRQQEKADSVRTAMNLLHQQLQQEKEDFRRKYAHTYFGLYELDIYVLQMDAVTAREWYDLCSEASKASPLGQQVKEKIRVLSYLAPGSKVPDFRAATPRGDTLSLYELKGQVKLIDFWSSGCGRCREENKLLIPLYRQYHSQGFEIISVSLDTRRDMWIRAIDRDGLPWPQVSDLKGVRATSLADLYGVPSLPYTVLVDAENRVIARDIHYEELKDELPGWLK